MTGKQALKNAQEKIYEKSNELKILEEEKAAIIEKFKCSPPSKQEEILSEMRASEERYASLLEETTSLLTKIKQLSEKLG